MRPVVTENSIHCEKSELRQNQQLTRSVSITSDPTFCTPTSEINPTTLRTSAPLADPSSCLI